MVNNPIWIGRDGYAVWMNDKNRLNIQCRLKDKDIIVRYSIEKGSDTRTVDTDPESREKSDVMSAKISDNGEKISLEGQLTPMETEALLALRVLIMTENDPLYRQELVRAYDMALKLASYGIIKNANIDSWKLGPADTEMRLQEKPVLSPIRLAT